MKKLVTLGVLVAILGLAGTTFAGDGLLDRELQKLFAWSAQATSTARTQMAGPGAQAASSVPSVLEYRGSDIN